MELAVLAGVQVMVGAQTAVRAHGAGLAAQYSGLAGIRTGRLRNLATDVMGNSHDILPVDNEWTGDSDADVCG